MKVLEEVIYLKFKRKISVLIKEFAFFGNSLPVALAVDSSRELVRRTRIYNYSQNL